MRAPLLLILFAALALLSATPTHAAEIQVDAILIPMGNGWQVVRSDPAATRDGPRGNVTLKLGEKLFPGDVVRTGNARVRLRLKGDQQLVVAEGSSLEFAIEGHRVQAAGDVLYRVGRTTEVRMPGAILTNKGGRFVVRAGQGVAIHEGRGHLRTRADEANLKKGDWAQLQGPDLTGVSKRRDANPYGARKLGSTLGQPRVSLGLEGGGGVLNGGALGSGRLVGRFGVHPLAEIYVEAGMGFDASRFHIPAALGAALRWGALRVGLGGAVRMGPCDNCGGSSGLVVKPGPQLQLGAVIPLGGRANLSFTARGEYLFDFWAAEGAAGVMFGL